MDTLRDRESDRESHGTTFTTWPINNNPGDPRWLRVGRLHRPRPNRIAGGCCGGEAVEGIGHGVVEYRISNKELQRISNLQVHHARSIFLVQYSLFDIHPRAALLALPLQPTVQFNSRASCCRRPLETDRRNRQPKGD